MKNICLFIIAVTVILICPSCSDSPSDKVPEYFSYELTIESVTPDYITTKMTYYSSFDEKTVLYLDNYSEPVTVYSPRFRADTFTWLFDVQQWPKNDIEQVDEEANTTGISFTILITSYDSEGVEIETKDYTFDNIHSVDPGYMPELFPRSFSFGLVDDGNGNYTLRRFV